jgi:hypothetical protein
MNLEDQYDNVDAFSWFPVDGEIFVVRKSEDRVKRLQKGGKEISLAGKKCTRCRIMHTGKENLNPNSTTPLDNKKELMECVLPL